MDNIWILLAAYTLVTITLAVWSGDDKPWKTLVFAVWLTGGAIFLAMQV